ncbi:MAG: phage holin family protein [Betaproteobacteria bacterium]|nr:phage holin family protein [Betaproteobacteria bacterium]
MSNDLGRLPEDVSVDPRPANGVREELAQLGASFASLVSSRFELARLEYIETHRQTARQLTLLVLAAVFLGMAFVVANVLLVISFWDTPHRTEVLVWMIVVYFVLGMLLLWRLAVARRRSSKPFSATLAEFEKDRQWLATGLSSKARLAASKKANRESKMQGRV